MLPRRFAMPELNGLPLALLVVWMTLVPERESSAQENELPPPADRKVEYVKDIQPLFKKHCYECHGSEMQEAGFRLDRKADALAGGDSGEAITVGESAESLLVKYIGGLDQNIVMPPSGDRLKAEQIGLVRAWIDQGAKWPDGVDKSTADPRRDHWSYQPLDRGAPPAVQDPWVQSPIDAFVLSRLNKAGIKPSPEASREKLIRRLYLDLLGLPPSVQQVESFVNDSNPQAYANLVDELLKSPHFGERWGRHWLDMARYADSDGYEKDRPRMNAWRWRDWVIQAINDDMPFDQFTIEQLAGDLIPDATVSQKLATAFHRQTLTNTEGGTDQEQFRVEAVFDRIETTGTVWLGLTVGCARCHSHKYDAISQREYYQLFAFLNNADETTMNVPRSQAEWDDYTVKLASWKQELSRREEQLEAARSSAAPAALELAARLSGTVATQPVTELIRVTGGTDLTFETLEDGSVLVGGAVPDKVTYNVTLEVQNSSWITGFRIHVLPDDKLPGRGPGRAPNGNFVLSRFEAGILPAAAEAESVPLKFVTATASFAQNEFAPELALEPRNGWAISPQMGKSHSALFQLASPLLIDGKQSFDIRLVQDYGGKHTLGRFRLEAVAELPEPVLAALGRSSDQWTDQDREALIATFAQTVPAVSQAESAVAAWRTRAPQKPEMNVRVLMQRNPKQARSTRVLRRGDFLQPGNNVEPGVLEVLHELPQSDKPHPDRLDFAMWLVDQHNPLTPRVAVNHLWKHLFGRGIVGTVNDFGVRGDQPTHPRLLDWLAAEYQRLGWSRKALIRRIVMSSTYRQSSAARPELADVDPGNMLLYRQNRFRVEGEIVRDISLAVAGLLSDKVGGPSVFPPMPSDVAALSYANNFSWKESQGADRYRRGMYTFFKRTAPHPNLTTFDCPDANTTCVERRTSNTPLQALTTLNNVVYLDAARGLADRLRATDGETDTERLDRGFRMVVSRPPESGESQALHQLLLDSREWFSSHQEEAHQLTGSGDQAGERAAWIAVSRILLNLDEFLTRE